MNRARQTAALSRLAQMRLDRERADIAGVLAAEQRLRHAIMTLRDQQRAAAAPDPGTALPYWQASRWQAWTDNRISALNSELAAVMAIKVQQMDGLRIAFGRAQVCARLSEKETAQARRERTRKAFARQADRPAPQT